MMPEKTLTDLISTYGDKVYTLSFNMTGDPEAAEDITQETFIQVHRHLGEFRGESRIFTWIYAIARNACRRHLKREKKKSFAALEKLITEAGRTASPDVFTEVEKTHYVRQVKDGCLLGLLRCLSFRQRIAFILNILFELAIDDVSAVIGTSANSARILVHRARRNLKRFLCDNCSLYAAGSRCRCENLIAFSLKQGWIEKYDPAVSPQKIESEISALRGELELFQTLPSRKADGRFSQAIASAVHTGAAHIFSKRKVK